MPVAIALVYVAILLVVMVFALSFGGALALAVGLTFLAGAKLAEVWWHERSHRHYPAHGGRR